MLQGGSVFHVYTAERYSIISYMYLHLYNSRTAILHMYISSSIGGRGGGGLYCSWEGEEKSKSKERLRMLLVCILNEAVLPTRAHKHFGHFRQRHGFSSIVCVLPIHSCS